MAEGAGHSRTPDLVLLGTFVGVIIILFVWIASFAVAGVSAVATVRGWSLLSPARRAFGLLPWGAFLAEFTLLLALWLLG